MSLEIKLIMVAKFARLARDPSLTEEERFRYGLARAAAMADFREAQLKAVKRAHEAMREAAIALARI